ncbi:alpha/beta hydrolase [Novosphingobium colocasiae]|uniref:alpha/beta hydrolase n=1 Tax=Novosphingobium colocasiae TaxID=1256513 RepID=UPI0035B25578
MPVLFVMDADFEFAMAAEIVRLATMGGARPGAIVVGVGYGMSDFAAFSRLRTADLTPPVDDENVRALGSLTGLIGDRYGGAHALLAFLIDTLTSEIARRCPEASTWNHGLFGHSFGGLFTAYALVNRPDAFAAYFSVSPSLWWNGFALFDELPGFATRLAALARKPLLFMSVGSDEQGLPTEDASSGDDLRALMAGWRMVDAVCKFAEAVCGAGLADTRCAVFADEGHLSVIPAAMMRSVTLFLAASKPRG